MLVGLFLFYWIFLILIAHSNKFKQMTLFDLFKQLQKNTLNFWIFSEEHISILWIANQT